MSVREYNAKRRPLLGESNNSLVLLVAINAIVFVILNFLKIAYALSYDTPAEAELAFQQQILKWFVLPAQTGALLSKPWTVLSYMFSHYSASVGGVFMLISTVLWLWAFGYILQDLTGNNKLIPIYIYGGVAGAAFFVLSANFIPYLHQNLSGMGPLVGGGAAVMAVAVATTTLAPDYRLFPMINGGIPLWVVTLIFVAIDYASIANISGAYSIAHLAGGAIGFLFIRQLKRGNDWGNWMIRLANGVNDLFNPDKKNKQEDKKNKLFYRTDKQPYSKTPNLTQHRVDEILDKINQKGYHLLTEEEKEFLERASREEL